MPYNNGNAMHKVRTYLHKETVLRRTSSTIHTKTLDEVQMASSLKCKTAGVARTHAQHHLRRTNGVWYLISHAQSSQPKSSAAPRLTAASDQGGPYVDLPVAGSRSMLRICGPCPTSLSACGRFLSSGLHRSSDLPRERSCSEWRMCT